MSPESNQQFVAQYEADLAAFQEKKVMKQEAEVVALAAARQAAAETAKVFAPSNAAAAEEEAQIVWGEGHLTVAEAEAMMDEAGASPYVKGDFLNWCKKKDWGKANQIFHNAIKKT